MKANIGKYTRDFGPQELAKVILFWMPNEHDEFGFKVHNEKVRKLGEWLAYGEVTEEPEVGEVVDVERDRNPTWLYRLLMWINDKRQRKIDIHIDPWDTWNMDDTLSLIILPMLKQLKNQKQGSPHVDDEDLPEELRSATINEKWQYVLDEMIFSFNVKVNDTEWEKRFFSGNHDLKFEKMENGTFRLIEGNSHTLDVDWEGRNRYQERIDNGFRLFGKYFEHLWT